MELVSKKVDGRNVVSEARGLSSQEAADVFESFRARRGSVLFAVHRGSLFRGGRLPR